LSREGRAKNERLAGNSGPQKVLNLRAGATLLAGDGEVSSQSNNLGKLLDFFGVSWRASSASECLVRRDRANASASRLLSSAERFLELITSIEGNPERVQQWQEQIHSAFVYGGGDIASLQNLVKLLAGSEMPSLHNSVSSEFLVSNKLPDFCGVMAGVRIKTNQPGAGPTFAWPQDDRSTEIITQGHGAVFLKLEYEKVSIFLCTSRDIIDLEGALPDGIFDLRDHALRALPVVLYIKWAFAQECWNAPERSACLIIDDPLLKTSYGFVDFRRLLSLMQRHKFSSNIAFIPWNWRRSDPQVARLFRENPEHYSISVHGCAHTQSEFGSTDYQLLYGKTRRALAQMERHESITGINHDRVMVFPQGVFSETAMRILKRTDLIAAVNNDTISSDRGPRTIKIAEVWDTAVMTYGNFPLFTRRDPWSGIENFAFDSLLGKPVLVVIHHDYCRDQCARLIEFMERLNALACPLTWRGLGELVKRSCRQRSLSPDRVQVEMYATELRIENSSGHPKSFLINRREAYPSTIKEVCAGTRTISWGSSGDRIHFEVQMEARESVAIRVRFHELNAEGDGTENRRARARIMLRRYLSELRDNYVHKVSALSSDDN
jgi:hypothetical protein